MEILESDVLENGLGPENILGFSFLRMAKKKKIKYIPQLLFSTAPNKTELFTLSSVLIFPNLFFLKSIKTLRTDKQHLHYLFGRTTPF